MADVGSWSEAASSNNSAPPDGFPEGQSPSSLNDCGREIMASVKRWYDQINPTTTSTGTNSIALGYSVAPSTYVTGQRFAFKAGATTTSQATINVNSLGAKNLVTREGFRLNAGAIKSGKYYEVTYDGTNMVLIGPNAGKVLLWEQTAGNSTQIDFTSLDSSYDVYEVEIVGLRVANAGGSNLYCRTSESGTFKSGGTDYFYAGNITDGGSVNTPVADGGAGAAQMVIATSISSATGKGLHGWGRFGRMADSGSSAVNQAFRFIMDFVDTGPKIRSEVISGWRNNTTPAAQDGIRFLTSSGANDIVAGTFRLYGVVNG